MKGKASDICTKCKHCEGLDMFAKMYSCKHYNNYPDAAIGMDSEIECCNFEEVDTNKVEGKASDRSCEKCERFDVDHLLSLNKKLDEKISELEFSRDAWSNTATARAEQVIEVTKDRDNWRKLYNSLSEACADYDKRCKEECEKKYRDEISKLQNIVTEKEVELKKRLKENIYLSQNKFFADTVIEKNKKLNQTISDQEITIKALLIIIKEMCKEDETNE